MIRIKRVYEPPAPEDGSRILVDRLWPRGISKTNAKIDLWLKEIAPSNELRKWYNHDPEKWAEFKKRYYREVEERPESFAPLLSLVKDKEVTLLYSSKELKINNAVALKAYLEARLKNGKS
jgi:uncharacterized protein YeaO (DUF488 family)